ncbi:MAG: hypothetical protein ACK5Q1_18880, partial [Limnobacter sp.]
LSVADHRFLKLANSCAAQCAVTETRFAHTRLPWFATQVNKPSKVFHSNVSATKTALARFLFVPIHQANRL